MRRGTQRLAVRMVVVCLAATSCAAATDDQTADGRNGAPLSVRVGGDPEAVALVEARQASAVFASTRARMQERLRRQARARQVTFRRKVSPAAPLRVAFLGDSVAFSLTPALAAAGDTLVSRKHLPFVPAGGFKGPGFGLTADVPGHNDIGPTAPPEAYANWQESVRRMVLFDDPDVVIVLLGIWDTIERSPAGRPLAPGMPEWEQWYAGLAHEFVKTLTARGAVVLWLLMPCVGRADLNARLNHVNTVLRGTRRVAPGQVGLVELSKVACHGDTPIYQATGPLGPVTVREADGIHFRPFEAPVVMSPFLARRFESLLRGVRATPTRPRTI